VTLLLFFALLVSLPSAARSEERYDWPLHLAPALTSTFAEYRSGRFHAGLDIKTWGKEGIPCVAVDEGYVWRVRTSPWGYGKAVYIRLKDGWTAVYAHLSAFSPSIERIVAEEQDRRQAYSVNLYLQAGRLPVERGEVIAYSGSTGSGYPHLHFEIREGQYGEVPQNPLIHGFGVADTIAPTPVSVAFVPMDVTARIASGADIHTVPVVWEEGRERYGTSPVSLWGRVGIAFKVFDRADASALTNRLAPFRIRLIADGRELFRTTYDAFSYAQVRRVDLDRNFHLTRAGRRGYHNLFLLQGNDLPIYTSGAGVVSRPGSGVLSFGIPGDESFETGSHDLAIVVEDVNGNHAVTHIPVRVVRRSGRSTADVPSQTSIPSLPLSLKAVYYETHAVVRVVSPKPMVATPRVRLLHSDTQPSTLLVDEHTAHIPIDRAWGRDLAIDVNAPMEGGQWGSAALSLRTTLIDRQGGEVVSEDGVARAVLAQSNLYDGIYTQIEVDSTVADLAQVEGLAYRFEPASIPFREMVQVQFRVPEGTPDPVKLGVYEWTNKGWSFVWNDQDPEQGTVGAGVWQFSTYALIRDEVPPVVEQFVPKEGERVNSMPSISVSLRDSLSGIPMEELISMTLDGQPMIFEFDPEAEVAKGILRSPLSAGPHEVTVRVEDVCGNVATETRRFIVLVE